MYQELESIGFTQREIKVYIALLEVGTSSVGKIIQKSGIPSSKIYDTLDKLKEKGFVSSLVQNNKLYFTAESPERILNYLDEQRNNVAETAVPELKLLEKKEKQERSATLYENIKGIKSIYELMLRTGKPIYVLGAPNIAQEKLTAYLLEFNKKRIKKRIKMEIIYHSDARKHGKIREKMPLTKVKYFEKDFVSPAWVDIFGDYVVIFNIEGTSTGNLIKDKHIAASFKKYFKLLWDTARV